MITTGRRLRDEIALPTSRFYDAPDTPFNPVNMRRKFA